jgi:predicted LPLAT superfamily acyltransferase
MSGHWATQRERGSVFGMKLIVRFTAVFGRGASRILLYPVCLYFMLFVRRSTHASRQYLGRLYGRPATWREVFRHYFCFAATLLDRGLLLAGLPHQLNISSENVEVVRRLAVARRGSLLLGAHLGSFDVARMLGEVHRHADIQMMMYEDNAQKVNTAIASLGGRDRMKVIPIGAVDSLIRAQDRIDRGEWIGMLGDRVVTNDRLVRVPFLGQEAVFPSGPFLVASALKVPVVLFVCLYLGGNRYQEYFELFSEEIVLSRSNRAADLEQWVRRYAERLEYYCRLAPYNWFNFYDFWSMEPTPGPVSVTSRAA